MNIIDLSKITLCAISSVKIPETIKAIEICKKYCAFKDIIFFSDQDVPYGKKISQLSSIQDYNNFVLFKLPNLVDSEFILTIHWDGFIINPDSWINEFYNYDYIGAPWRWIGNICGNGGFCLKSKKFLEAQKEIISSNNIPNNAAEDLVLCYYLRQQFIQKKCVYAPPEIAYKFSTETIDPNFFTQKPFGFHDFKYHPQYRLL